MAFRAAHASLHPQAVPLLSPASSSIALVKPSLASFVSADFEDTDNTSVTAIKSSVDEDEPLLLDSRFHFDRALASLSPAHHPKIMGRLRSFCSSTTRDRKIEMIQPAENRLEGLFHKPSKSPQRLKPRNTVLATNHVMEKLNSASSASLVAPAFSSAIKIFHVSSIDCSAAMSDLTVPNPELPPSLTRYQSGRTCDLRQSVQDWRLLGRARK